MHEVKRRNFDPFITSVLAPVATFSLSGGIGLVHECAKKYLHAIQVIRMDVFPCADANNILRTPAKPSFNVGTLVSIYPINIYDGDNV